MKNNIVTIINLKMNFMRKLFSLCMFVMLFTLAANAQAPELKFENMVHDFDSIQENDGMVTTTFEFTNEGDAPLIINKVSASCGCTTPDWTREPIPAQGKGFVKVTYNPKGRPGPFAKSITVRSNSSEHPVILKVKGKVIRTT